MKIWMTKCQMWDCDDCGGMKFKIQFGLDWYKHAKPNRKFKPWTGYTIALLFFKWYITLNYVDDYDAYDKKINWYKYKLEKMRNEIDSKRDSGKPSDVLGVLKVPGTNSSGDSGKETL